MCLLPYPPRSNRGSTKKKSARPIHIIIPPVLSSPESSTSALPPHLKVTRNRCKTAIEGMPVIKIEGNCYHQAPPIPAPPPLPTAGEMEAKARKQKIAEQYAEKKRRRDSILDEIDFMHALQEKLYPHLAFVRQDLGRQIGVEGEPPTPDVHAYPLIQGHLCPPPRSQYPAPIKIEKEAERVAALAEQKKLEKVVAGVQGQLQGMLKAQELKDARKEGKQEGRKEGEKSAKETYKSKAEIEKSVREDLWEREREREKEKLGWQWQRQYEMLLRDNERRERSRERAKREDRDDEREKERQRREEREKERDAMIELAGLRGRDNSRQHPQRQQREQQQQQIPYFVPIIPAHDNGQNNALRANGFNNHNNQQDVGFTPFAFQNQGALCDPYMARKVVVKLDNIQDRVHDLLLAQQQRAAGGTVVKAQARRGVGGCGGNGDGPGVSGIGYPGSQHVGGGGRAREGWDHNNNNDGGIIRGGNGHGLGRRHYS